MPIGGCQCGAVRYEVSGEPEHCALCHCKDCRASTGAPMVAWTAYKQDDFKITQGTTVDFNSSGNAHRHFCGTCGTGLYYTNAEFLPGIVDIQTATLDDAESTPPQAHIQTADRLSWMENAHSLPEFERFPGQ
jgi:hypothetical protein